MAAAVGRSRKGWGDRGTSRPRSADSRARPQRPKKLRLQQNQGQTRDYQPKYVSLNMTKITSTKIISTKRKSKRRQNISFTSPPENEQRNAFRDSFSLDLKEDLNSGASGTTEPRSLKIGQQQWRRHCFAFLLLCYKT